MTLQTMIAKNGVIRINDQYPRSPRQTIRITTTTNSSVDVLSLRDRSLSFTDQFLFASPAFYPHSASTESRRSEPRSEEPLWLSTANLCRFVGVPPPDGGKTRGAKFRHFVRPAKAVPPKGALLAIGPWRYNVVVPEQHPIESLGSRH